MARLLPKSQGLDYGCGPGPALAHMLREAGHDVALFDPFFAPDPAPFNRTYDFVTCTEVAEHFHIQQRSLTACVNWFVPAGGLPS